MGTFTPTSTHGPASSLIQNYTPYIPTVYFYDQPFNPGVYDVYYGGDDRTGTLLVEGVRDPQGDTARKIVEIGAVRNAAVTGRTAEPIELNMGLNSPLDHIVSRRFAFVKLVNGRTGRSSVIEIRRSAKRAPR
jgi:hypothetical protein